MLVKCCRSLKSLPYLRFWLSTTYPHLQLMYSCCMTKSEVPTDVVFTCRGPAEWRTELEEVARRAGVSLSAVLRAAIANYVRQRAADPLRAVQGPISYSGRSAYMSVEQLLRERGQVEGWSVARMAAELALGVPAGGDVAQWVERLELEAAQ